MILLQGQHLDHIFEVNLIQIESKRVNLSKSLIVLVTPKSSLAFSDAIQEGQVPEHESIYITHFNLRRGQGVEAKKQSKGHGPLQLALEERKKLFLFKFNYAGHVGPESGTQPSAAWSMFVRPLCGYGILCRIDSGGTARTGRHGKPDPEKNRIFGEHRSVDEVLGAIREDREGHKVPAQSGTLVLYATYYVILDPVALIPSPGGALPRRHDGDRRRHGNVPGRRAGAPRRRVGRLVCRARGV